MTLKNRSSVIVGAILVLLVVVAGGLTYFADTGQFSPASKTGATMSDQRDSTVSNDVANHQK